MFRGLGGQKDSDKCLRVQKEHDKCKGSKRELLNSWGSMLVDQC